ncbi:MAG: hypothetical protein J6K87_00465, partial [Clostridia bacterium]|nr:hypothetical protein [Clostridia bacterium]
GARSFVLNRESDWTYNSTLRNLKFQDDNLILDNKDGESGVYISGAFDSLLSETKWHRLKLDINIPTGVEYKLRIYSSDSTEILIPVLGQAGKTRVNINNYLLDNKINIARKIDMFDTIGAKIYENPTDILLYEFTGRYLWLCLEIISYVEDPVEIKSMKIEFPQVTFVDYLPELYRTESGENSFLSRFLGIFQSIYVDLEDKIDIMPLKFDPDYTSRDFLNWIADWLSIKDIELWGEKRLRKLIKECVSIYKIKGTRKAISRVVEDYIGVEPIIVEQFEIKNNMFYHNQVDILENLFGDNGYVFTVMLPQSCVKDTENYIELLRVINNAKPVDSICNLVILTDQIYLDNHCYIGINSFITKNQDLILNKSQRDTNNLVISENITDNKTKNYYSEIFKNT